jgi:hypothetical protein
MTRLSWGIALSVTAAAAGCKDDPVTFTDAGPDVDAAPAIDAAVDGLVEARCGDGIRVPGEVCFRAGPQHLVTENPPNDAQLADVDGDGDLDVFYLAGGEMRYHVNTGGGVFAEAFAAGFASYGGQIDTRDLDGDGRVEILIGDWDQFTLWRSGGTAPITHTLAGTIATPTNLRDIVFANLDGAGRPEVVALHEGQLQLATIGADLSLTAGDTLVIDPNQYGMTTGRFDADGRDDLLVSGAAGVLLLRGNAAGGLEAPVATGISEWKIVASDVDGDGHADVVSTAQETQVLVARGNGDGTFQPQVMLEAPVWTFAVGDLDGDGNDDMLALDYDGRLQVLLGRDEGTLAAAVMVPVEVTTWADTIAIGGDVNGDGAPDVVINDGESEIVTVLISDP